MTAKVILNPYAGRWKARNQLENVRRYLLDENIDFEIEQTTAHGHAIKIAEKAVQNQYNPIIVAGGDGTISEVVNGMMTSLDNGLVKTLPNLGVLPLGSANDLAVNLNMPIDLQLAVKSIVMGKDPKYIDLGIVNSRYFDNNSAIGLEPTITVIQQGMKRLRGTLRYLVATLVGVMQNPSWNVAMEWNDGSYEGPVTLVTVGNNPITGGLFYVTPHADPFDGLLTFVYGYMPTRLKILNLLPKTMRNDSDNYIYHPDIHEINSDFLNISIESESPLHADGEILSKNAKEMTFRIRPSCLPIILN